MNNLFPVLPARILALALIALIAINLNAQSVQSVHTLRKSLYAALDRADTLSPFDRVTENIFDTITSTNNKIGHLLSLIFISDEMSRIRLDTFLNHNSLGITHSDDRQLWIFNWYENTRGSWKSNLNLIGYVTANQKRKTVFAPEVADEGNDVNQHSQFCAEGAWFDHIYSLGKKTSGLYLCTGSGISCNTCMYMIASAVSLEADTIHFDYPAFGIPENPDPLERNNPSCFVLDARMGNIEKFEYDTKKQALCYSYIPDDLTPMKIGNKKKVTETLFFDGNIFSSR